MAARTVRLTGEGEEILLAVAARKGTKRPYARHIARALKLYRIYLDGLDDGARLELVTVRTGKRTRLELMWDD